MSYEDAVVGGREHRRAIGRKGRKAREERKETRMRVEIEERKGDAVCGWKGYAKRFQKAHSVQRRTLEQAPLSVVIQECSRLERQRQSSCGRRPMPKATITVPHRSRNAAASIGVKYPCVECGSLRKSGGVRLHEKNLKRGGSSSEKERKCSNAE